MARRIRPQYNRPTRAKSDGENSRVSYIALDLAFEIQDDVETVPPYVGGRLLLK